MFQVKLGQHFVLRITSSITAAVDIETRITGVAGKRGWVSKEGREVLCMQHVIAVQQHPVMPGHRKM